MMKNLVHGFKRKNKGQSFVEMAFVVGILLLLLTGMVEFGNLLNQYINLIDGAREGARFGSNNDPFIKSDKTYDYSTIQDKFYTDIARVIEGDTSVNPLQRSGAISPLSLNHAGAIRSNGETILPDDILITFFSVEKGVIVHTFPTRSMYSSGHTTQIDTSKIQTLLDPNAPATGILLVEIFYTYKQLLNLPFFTVWVPNPVPVHTYAFMPLASAEATQVP